MANAELIDEEIPKKKGKKGLIIGLVLALIAAGGGFYAAFSGMLPIGAKPSENTKDVQEKVALKALSNHVFVALDPLIVSIRSSSKYRLLRFSGQLEVEPEHAADIEALKPRIMDVMNTYLNALEAARFEDPIALMKLRAQLLRRIQIVTGEGRIKDLLIMEFVLQ